MIKEMPQKLLYNVIDGYECYRASRRYNVIVLVCSAVVKDCLIKKYTHSIISPYGKIIILNRLTEEKDFYYKCNKLKILDEAEFETRLAASSTFRSLLMNSKRTMLIFLEKENLICKHISSVTSENIYNSIFSLVKINGNYSHIILEKTKEYSDVKPVSIRKPFKKSHIKLMSSFEEIVNDFIKENNLGFVYSGRKAVFENKRPDFINVKDKKIIEVFYSFYKTHYLKMTIGEYERERNAFCKIWI